MLLATLLLLLLAVTLGRAVVVPSDGQHGDECRFEDGVAGYCEDVWECLSNDGVVVHNNVVQLCEHDAQRVNVCCRKPHNVAKQLCDVWSEYWRTSAGTCITERQLVLGGTDANLGEFPYMARVGRKETGFDIEYKCGGTLISPYHVLTAAHCVDSNNDDYTYWVRLGDHDRTSDLSYELIDVVPGPVSPALYGYLDLVNQTQYSAGGAPKEQVIEVEKTDIYQEYMPSITTISYRDIALLRLKTPAWLTRLVLPACLPQHPGQDYTNHSLTIMGWGRTGLARVLARVLKKAKVNVVDQLTCYQQLLEHLRPSGVQVNMLRYGITSDMICAVGPNTDSCKGDSGGPLADDMETVAGAGACEHTVVGVVSFGVGPQGSCGTMGVYTRVSSFLDWITGLVAPNSSGSTA